MVTSSEIVVKTHNNIVLGHVIGYVTVLTSVLCHDGSRDCPRPVLCHLLRSHLPNNIVLIRTSFW